MDRQDVLDDCGCFTYLLTYLLKQYSKSSITC